MVSREAEVSDCDAGALPRRLQMWLHEMWLSLHIIGSLTDMVTHARPPLAIWGTAAQ